MKRRTFFRSFFRAVAGAAGAMACGQAFGAAAARRPNIVFILTDDQGAWAWGDGHPNAYTPNLNRLRAEGAVLANYFNTTPVCSPSRASLLTSRYATETGITDYLSPERMLDLGLDAALPAWPRFFSDAGYRTGLIGKWHVGEQDRHLPQRFGYQYFAGWRHGAGTSQDPDIEIDGRVRNVEGYTPDILTDLAVDFIRHDDDRPFLLSLHYWAPHANTKNNTPDGDRTWLPLSDADWDRFKDLDPTLPEPSHPDLDVPRAERMTREYLASVASVDRNLGRLFAELEDRGLAETTLVVFTSDNGFNMAHHGIWHKGNGRWLLTHNQGDRPNMWDTSLRAPAIVRWPGRIAPGSTMTHTATNLDWFPTLLAAAGVPVPEDAALRGRDLMPLLEGEEAAWNDDLFAQYAMWDWNQNGANLRAYRTTDWKLIRDFKHAGQDELYHLAADPAELHNLIDSDDPAVIQARERLETLLRKAMAHIHDPALES
jgi:choline-sulfatase